MSAFGNVNWRLTGCCNTDQIILCCLVSYCPLLIYGTPLRR